MLSSLPGAAVTEIKIKNVQHEFSTLPGLKEDIVELMRIFLPDTVNQARLVDRIDGHINRVVEMGFLRRLAGQENRFEVRRVIKAFVDAQWLNEFEQRLAGYREQQLGGAAEREEVA